MKAAIVALLFAATGIVGFLVSTTPEDFDFDQVDVSEHKAALAACLGNQKPSVPEGFTSISIPLMSEVWFAGVGGEGYYRLRNGRLEVHFDSTTIRLPSKVNPYTPIAEHFVEGVQVGLAIGEPRDMLGQSEDAVVVRWGEMLHINQTMTPGEKLKFDDYATSLFVADIQDLDDYYFVLKADITFSFDFYRPTYAPEIPEVTESLRRAKCRDY